MSYEEVATYNTLVCGIQSNLVITAMEGETSGFEDSFLHPSQAREARKALLNIRRVCIGWSRIIPTLSFKHYTEFLDMLSKLHHNGETIDSMKEFVRCAENEEWTRCPCCTLELPLLLVLPCCGQLVCTECVQERSCTLCDQDFDRDTVEWLQKLQPGFDLQWRANVVESLRRRAPGTITGDPETFGIALDETNDGNAIVAIPGVALLPNERRRASRFGDGHVCRFDRQARDGRCVLCRSEHECDLRGLGETDALPECRHCGRIAEACPTNESKARYLAETLAQSIRAPGQPLKVIVFSQFREALNCVGHRLLKRFGAACIAEYWGRFRTQELSKFVASEACFCMLLSKDGSEGLDLSFVTHIFFIEAVWDKALEEQVVARAWRMGATGSVSVETLVAEHSIEEIMHNVHEGLEASEIEIDIPDDPTAETRKRKRAVNAASTVSSRRTVTYDFNRDKTLFLLASLRFITSCHRFGESRSAIQGLPEPQNNARTGKRERTGKRVRFVDS
jgi:Helicase conserved C-terminal domain